MTTQPTVQPSLPLAPSDEEVLLRKSVHSISARYGPAYFRKVVDAGEPATDLWRELAENGFFGVHLPEEYDGGGGGLSDIAVVLEETAAAGVPALAAVFSSGVNGTILAQHGTDEQKDRWLRGLATGQTMSSFAITEPDAGHNSFNISTSARREGDDWILNGQKYYISGFDEAEFVIVVAKTGQDDKSGRGLLTLFIVDTDAPGVSHQPLPTALQVPEKQSTVYFDDVRVGTDRILGKEHHGIRAAFAGINAERLLVSSICTGVGRYALDKAVRYASERTVWKAPIGSHQGIAHPLAESKVALETARLMTAKACMLYDLGRDGGEAANMAKLTGVDAGLHCLDAAIQTHGGNGVALEYQLSNYWFLLRMLEIGPVSKEMILNFIAEHTLGLPRSY
ncbi:MULTISPECIES: acyl-CoA dehydrogenase family protein [unclassified Pseudonocardia]|uniref:acyl-CoA dehydrogenase family protein n=2 Tax=Pseudonocardia TaxID=1847 RepID=UPI0009FA41C0|nr:MULTISPECIES: acyl-CoA dehydrogenase family protein [unclassified Pseudonocardia]